jgi:hypothetical protein
MNLAPIALFVYNRPWHTQQTIQALLNNIFSSESNLFIFSDAPKNDLAIDEVKKVRTYIHSIRGFKNIEIIEHEKNIGLADSIVSGVTEIIRQYGKIIVLEDDIITSPGFLRYMNEALSVYEYEDHVMHISAWMFPIKNNLPSTFFYNVGSCWGWGTWARAWKHLNIDSEFLYNEIVSKNLVSKFNNDGGYNFLEQLERNRKGEIKTWAVKWYASFFLKNGFALHPNRSLTNNIGNDSSGTNCNSTGKLSWKELAILIDSQKIPIMESIIARDLVSKFWKEYYKPNFYNQLKIKLHFILKKRCKYGIGFKCMFASQLQNFKF